MNATSADRLDLVLGGDPEAGPDLAPLAGLAAELEAMFKAPAPRVSAERAMFVQGVGAHAPRASVWRFIGPSAILVGLLALVGFLGHAAVPGQALYSVRQAMSSIGLAETPLTEAVHRIDSAKGFVAHAESSVDSAPAAAETLALRAITELGTARLLLHDVDQEAAATMLSDVGRLEARAEAVIIAVDGSNGAAPQSSRGTDRSGDVALGSQEAGSAGPSSHSRSTFGPSAASGSVANGPGATISGSGTTSTDGADGSGDQKGTKDGSGSSGSGSGDPGGTGSASGGSGSSGSGSGDSGDSGDSGGSGGTGSGSDGSGSGDSGGSGSGGTDAGSAGSGGGSASTDDQTDATDQRSGTQNADDTPIDSRATGSSTTDETDPGGTSGSSSGGSDAL
jgi:hypothetical protein